MSLPVKGTRNELEFWKNPYKGCSLSVFAPEGHLDYVLVAGSLVEGLALLERRAVKMQAGRAVSVTAVLHPVQAHGVWNSMSHVNMICDLGMANTSTLTSVTHKHVCAYAHSLHTHTHTDYSHTQLTHTHQT